jgi:fatty-acyl-CoA synthase
VPLRAMAAEHALAEALGDQPGVLGVSGHVSNGAPAVVISLDSTADRADVERLVKSFPVRHDIRQR